MRNRIKYKLSYVEDGKEKEQEMKIFFISNSVNNRYSDLVTEITKFKKKYDRMTRCLQDRGELLVSRPENWKDEIKKLTDEQNQLEKDLRAYDDKKITRERVELLKTILKQNGIKDKKLFDDKFWDDCVEPSEQMDFLITAVLKDNSAGGQKQTGE